MNKLNRLFLLIISLILCEFLTSCNTMDPSNDNSNIIYVDVDAHGKNDGTSWFDAFTSLQDALFFAQANSEIWVSEGTYYPTEDNDRSISFVMKDDVDLYGGFSGNETTKNQRDWQNNKTILSGDIAVKNLKTDNSIKVVIAANNIIDGFIISDGYFSQGKDNNLKNNERNPIDNSSPDKIQNNKLVNTLGHLTFKEVLSGSAKTSLNGNGIIIWKVSPIIRNCTITNNESDKGSGVYIMGTSGLTSLPTFINTTISNNTAQKRGGGVAMDMKSTAIFIDCVFDSNKCIDGKGGAIYNDFGCSPLLENCLFIGNLAQSGGAIANDGGSNPIISNSTFYNNEAQEAGAALYQGTGEFNDPTVIDSIIYNNVCLQDEISIYNWNESNPIVSFSIIEGGYEGIDVLDTDPMFVDSYNFNFNLESNSPALSASYKQGRIGFNPEIIYTRDTIDYEEIIEYLLSIKTSSYEPIKIDVSNPLTIEDVIPTLQCLYVDVDAIGNNDGSSWNNAYTSLQDAINAANIIYNFTNSEVDLWVAEGSYVTGTVRSDSIILQSGVNIYGGFKGDETSLEQRDLEKYKTIISGEIGDKTTQEDNSYHVIIAADNVIIDGVIITGGYADGVDGEVYDNKGGGILNYLAGERVIPSYTPTLGFDIEINNVVFMDNFAKEGAAVYTYHGGNPIFNNCEFVNNIANSGGAVLDRAGTNSIYNNCEFISNYAKYKGGAVFCDYGSMSSFNNCSFDQNQAGARGGAIYVIDRASQEIFNETDFYLIDASWSKLTDIFSSIYLENCSFSNNFAINNGGALYVYENSYAKIINSYFYNNVSKDSTIVANNGSTIYVDKLTTFENIDGVDSYNSINKSSIL